MLLLSFIHSPDGNYVAAGSSDGTVYVWETWTGKMKSKKEHAYVVLCTRVGLWRWITVLSLSLFLPPFSLFLLPSSSVPPTPTTIARRS